MDLSLCVCLYACVRACVRLHFVPYLVEYIIVIIIIIAIRVSVPCFSSPIRPPQRMNRSRLRPNPRAQLSVLPLRTRKGGIDHVVAVSQGEQRAAGTCRLRPRIASSLCLAVLLPSSDHHHHHHTCKVCRTLEHYTNIHKHTIPIFRLVH